MRQEAANTLVDIIRDIVANELEKQDKTILCRVVFKNDSNHYDVSIIPDSNKILNNIVNMTRCDLQPGDICYVFAIDNDLRNAFICYAPDSTDQFNNIEDEIEHIEKSQQISPKNSHGIL